jgi:potassium-transporting ATPase KdpC subunit
MIKKETITALRVFIGFSILVGLVYPLFITAIAQIIMPYQANGSLIKMDEKVIGSSLIGQKFTDPKYFYSRPSAIDYNAAGSGADNLGPSSKKLMALVENRVKKVRTENNLKQNEQIPADMVLTSASGLDPHISVENALIQANRIAKVRNISRDKIINLITQNTDPDFIGIWGKSGVNVLKLNLALNKLYGNK